MKVPLVSVLIPCYNAEKYIGETLESVFQQTWRKIEVIVVDDGSTDRSIEIIQQYEAANCLVIREGHGGACFARNRALKEAQGDFIQYLDADDILGFEKIASQIHLLDNSPNGNICSCAWSHFSSYPGEQEVRPEPVWRNFRPEEFLIASWMGGGMMPPIAWLTPRSIVDDAGPWNEELSVNDDGEYFARAILASSGVTFCPEASVYYRTTAAPSVSKDKSRKGMVSALRAIELSSSHLLSRVTSKEARLASACSYQRFVFDCYPAFPDLVKRGEEAAHLLGGGVLRCPGGPAFRITSNLLGWKAARRVQAFTHCLFTRRRIELGNRSLLKSV